MKTTTINISLVQSIFVDVAIAIAIVLCPELAAAQSPATEPDTQRAAVNETTDLAAPNAANDTGEELGTVVIDLNKRIGTFHDWLEQQAQASKLPPDFAKRVARLADLRAQAETDAGARADYENEFSSMLTEFDTALEAYVAGQDETLRRIDDMESSLKEGKGGMDAAAKKSSEEYANHKKHADEIVASLVESGRKAKAIVDAGGTVPVEAQSVAVEAEGMRETADFLAQVAKAQADQARTAAKELGIQLEELKNLRAAFREDFQAAKNARLKTSAIGDYRKQIADSSALLAQVRILRGAHHRSRSVINNKAFKPLTDIGLGQNASSSSAAPVADNRGLKLMLDYANQNGPKSAVKITTTNPSKENP